MKRMIRAARDAHRDTKALSMNDVLILLHWIKELEGLEISLAKIPSGGTQLVVGDCAYPLEDLLPGLGLSE